MARIIVLDSGPLGEACRPHQPGAKISALTLWRIQVQASGAVLVIPEITDYEVRRELLRIGASGSLRRLKDLRNELQYLPITTTAMEKAASFWAEALARLRR